MAVRSQITRAWLLSLCMLFAGTAALLVVVAVPAASHSKVGKSTPAEGSVVPAGLKEIVLAFTKPVRLTVATLKGDAGASGTRLEPRKAAGFAKSYAFDTAPMAAGAYAVEWVAVAQDGHVMRGALRFEVRP
ncbi:MAG: copper resistance CopC family protein [Pseudomonadota bacterium]